LGTPQKITTTSGAVVWSAIYDAFGNSQISVETITSHLRFAGQYFDQETGLCYNLNRYYDPATGRYLQPDPLGQSLNPYAYVFNNPTGLIDPLGLCAVKSTWNWSVDKFWIGMDYTSDFVAGFGDTLTLGGTKWIREQWQQAFCWYDPVDYSSNAYTGGKWASYTWEVAFGVAGAAKSLAKYGVMHALKAGSIASSISGGLTFITEIAMGESTSRALKSSIINTSTAFVAGGLGSIKTGAYSLFLLTKDTNIIAQKLVNGSVNESSAIFTAAVMPVGGFALNLIREPIAAGVYGATFSLINAPWMVLSDAIF